MDDVPLKNKARVYDVCIMAYYNRRGQEEPRGRILELEDDLGDVQKIARGRLWRQIWDWLEPLRLGH